MRDINRIEPFLSKLEQLWQQTPDLRFGQIIELLNSRAEKDPFEMEENEWIKLVEDLIAEYKKKDNRRQ